MTYTPEQEHWLINLLHQGRPSRRWAKSEHIPEWPLEHGVWYRTPFYKDDHLIDPVEPDVALCGRPLEPVLWDHLVVQAEMNGVDIGPSHIYLSQRKGGKCTQCRNRWEDKGDRLLKEAGKVEDPESRYVKPLANKPKDRVAAHRFISKVTMVKRLLGATEEAA